MNPENNTSEYEQAKKIEHYSLTEIIYGSFTGATGLLAVEKFIEGRYGLGLACTGAGIFCGLMGYIGHWSIVDKIEESSRVAKSEKEELIKLNEFYSKILNYTQKKLDAVSQENKTLLAKDLEERCESGKEGAKILPFRKVPKRPKKDNGLLTQ